jgi:hypothetical protein
VGRAVHPIGRQTPSHGAGQHHQGYEEEEASHETKGYRRVGNAVVVAALDPQRGLCAKIIGQ